MATKTKAATPQLSDFQAEISEELERQDNRRRAAWGILLRAADEGGELTAEEIAFLNCCGFDDALRRREMVKANRALALLRKAGPKAERQQAAANAAELEAKLGNRVSGLEAEIAKLTEELKAAQNQLQVTKANAANRAAAVEQLRGDGVLPEFVKAQLTDLRRVESSSQPAADERQAEARLRTIRGVLKLTEPNDKLLHAQSARLSDGTDLVTRLANGKAINPRVDEVAWGRYLAELQAELPAVEAQLAEARKQLGYFTSESDQLRDFWLSDEIEQYVTSMEG